MLLSCNILFGSYDDTDYKKWKQPDRTEFTARYWGDEYFHKMQTKDGYTIYPSPDGWYYYATLDKRGEYTSSGKKVGIDKGPSSSLNLERSSSRIAELKNLQSLVSELKNLIKLRV